MDWEKGRGIRGCRRNVKEIGKGEEWRERKRSGRCKVEEELGE